jgi:hypothetical protein
VGHPDIAEPAGVPGADVIKSISANFKLNHHGQSSLDCYKKIILKFQKSHLKITKSMKKMTISIQ